MAYLRRQRYHLQRQRYQELRTKTTKQLKTILRTQNRPIGGKKDELIDRIMGEPAAWYKGLRASKLRQFIRGRKIDVTGHSAACVADLSKDELVNILLNADANWCFDFLRLPPGQILNPYRSSFPLTKKKKYATWCTSISAPN